MNRSQFSSTPHVKFEIHQINSAGKIRDSPTSSILKTPTAIFVTTRSSSAKTKRLKFANGPVDLQTLKNGTHESNVSFDSGVDSVEENKLNNNGEISFEDSVVEVAISPVKTMQVSPESWKAFLEYKKYSDYANETEKTDYTYSRLSKFRHKEIIPGFLIRPNLSRSSISSRRSSSFSFPSSQSSFGELYHSGSYDFKVHNQSNPEIIHDLKVSSQPNKFVRSKYYLRSSNSDWRDISDADANARNYLEKEYYVHSPEEKITKSYAYTTTETPELTSHYYGKVRSMDFDDADVDEVDVNPVHGEKHYYTSSGANVGRFGAGAGVGARVAQPQTVSQQFKNFFTTVFLYITSIATLPRDLFSKYILRRRQDDWSRSPYASYGWTSDGVGKSIGKSSWMPWGEKSAYSTGSYYSGEYYGQPRTWYQKIYHYFTDKFSQFTNLIWGSTSTYSSYRYQDTSRKRKFWWWLLIPLLLLAGSFLGYIDFFSNPKAILNTMYSWALFIPSFLHYTVMVFIPWLIFEAVPHLILKAIPNFIMVTLPYFVLNTLPHYFWVVVHFFTSLTLAGVWNMLVGAFGFVVNLLTTSGVFVYNLVSGLLSTGYFLSYKYLMLFYSNFCMQAFHVLSYLGQFGVTIVGLVHHAFTSLLGLWLFKAEQESGFLSNQYKELDCMTNGFFTSMGNAVKPWWRSCYIAYKRAEASASCYVNDSWERLKLPFSHLSDWLRSKFSSLSDGSLGFVFALWNGIWKGLWNLLTLTHDTMTNMCLFLLNFFTDFISAVTSMLYYLFKNFTDVFFSIFTSLGSVFGDAWKLLANTLRDLWSYLYLLLLAPRSGIRYEEYRKPDTSQEACVRDQKNIDKLTSEMENFKSFAWDLSSLKKKIDELEAEFRKEKEFTRSQNNLFDRQLGDNHKNFQKYQASVNHALFSSKRPAHLSSSSVQYLLDNQSDALKQWITQNFILKSDSVDLDESKIAPLIAKYGNKTGEELMALKRELQTFARNYKSDLESLRNSFNSLETNNLAGGDVSLAFVKKLIADAIKLYDADKTGRVDYALETAGGQVQSIRCTENYMESPKSYVYFGWPVYTETSSPRDAISPGMAAGQCWAFVGSQGFLVLKLSHTIQVTGFTMEHISKLLVHRGHIESAPKNFSMWGLRSEHDAEPYLFGEYAYLDNGETLQYFPVTYPTNERYNMVELKITSNHGNPNFTCLYRIRVHGDINPVNL